MQPCMPNKRKKGEQNMKYYRVKPQYDNKRLCVIKRGKYVNCGDILIARELYTVKEWEKIVKNHECKF